MKLPIIVHKEDVGFHIDIPDIEGAFTSAPTEEEIQPRVQDVVKMCMEYTKQKLPNPSTVEEVAASEDAQGGTVVLIDVDMSFLND